MKNKWYRSNMNFLVTLVPKEIKEILDMLPGTNGRYPREIMGQKVISIAVTLPVIPDDEIRAKYAEILKSSFDGNSNRLIGIDAQFIGFEDVKELTEEEVLVIAEEQRKK